MDLPLLLRQEAEKWAYLQGLSLEDFVWQAVAAKVSDLNQQATQTSEQTIQDVIPSTERPRIHCKDGILVIETAPFHLDVTTLIDEVREERIREQMVW